MTKRDKRLQKLRQNPQSVSFDELRSILEAHGFMLARVTGSHHIFVAERGERVWRLTIPFHKPLKAIYVKIALSAMDEINALSEEDADGNDES